MTSEEFTAFAGQFEEAFFLIGAAILAIELLKSAFSRTWSGKSALDMLASISTQIPYLLVEIFLMSFVYLAFSYISESWISWTLPVTLPVILLAILAADFAYYWEHRFAHEIRLLWTQHAVHHSSRFMNILVSVRFGPFESVTAALFNLPLILIGFPAELVFAGIIIVLGYQTWIHTELIRKLGPLEGLINTPANHRVHHGCDAKYIDKNYGGILIIWDRLFGTYQREEETPTYGLARDFSSTNPIRVWFSEWPRLFADIKRTKSGRETWGYLLKRPGWEPRD